MAGAILTLLVLGVCFFIFSQTYWIRFLSQARWKGSYPRQGPATLFDVKKLILEGEVLLAIRLYRNIYKMSFKEAKKAVEELQKSMKS